MDTSNRKQRLFIFGVIILLITVIIILVVLFSDKGQGPHIYDNPTATPTATPIATSTPIPSNPTPTPVATPTAAPTKVVVDLQDASSSVNMRYSASTDSDNIICAVPSGTEVKPLDIAGQWMKVSYQGEIGYIMTSFLKLTGSLNGYIKLSDDSSTVNLRATASSSGTIVTTLGNNTKITILSVGSDWIQITTGEYEGYVSSAFVRLSE
ncbi:MAG: SH3 domain-containing protein [Clostridia bacterium]|nr:SH3 domain-containing protein [Clostridia bacterium]